MTKKKGKEREKKILATGAPLGIVSGLLTLRPLLMTSSPSLRSFIASLCMHRQQRTGRENRTPRCFISPCGSPAAGMIIFTFLEKEGEKHKRLIG